MKYNLYNFGERLRQYRHESGLSQKKLAERIGATDSVIGFYEQGRSLPSLFNLCAIAEELGVTVGELCGEDGAYERFSSTHLQGFNNGMNYAFNLLEKSIRDNRTHAVAVHFKESETNE